MKARKSERMLEKCLRAWEREKERERERHERGNGYNRESVK